MTWKEALEASIKIWRKRAKDGNCLSHDCPLCLKRASRSCACCPIYSGLGTCIQEYYDWMHEPTRANVRAVLAVLIAARKHPKCQDKNKGKKA
jgi:hypothetical protein